ncbi:hypothetical protein FAF44_19870 [Nonomuraea sp. MG754425]|uniref:hypothetical protein n=1 Tax=Nonomuraea sp. MG754425 TaxID=2570319 RepID=UPI001F32BABE|nr:hypothetical protein [Nonomuraea sp. MG754425]MCF6470638.1 hypothetical protein [Nonomuraea sp. MG754425]
MIAVVVSLVAVVLLVLVVVALGMRSMNNRESSLPPERLKEMAEKEEQTQTRSTDQFAAHEPRMANFSPDLTPLDAPKPKSVRTGQRGKRGVDEWGTRTNDADADDEQFWANIRSDADEGGFGAGGTVAARKGASRPVERSERPERPAAEAERPMERTAERPAERPTERTAERPTERPAKRSQRARPRPAAAAANVDPEATTIQAPLPQRQPAAATAGLADLVEPQKRTPSQAELADQRTMTFAAPTADVLSILGAGAQPVPAPTRPEPDPSPRPTPVSSNATAAASPLPSSNAVSSNSAYPAAGGSGSFPAVSPTSSGSFPVAPAAPIHGAPTSDPFPAYGGGAADPLETTWTQRPASTTSGSWAASPDILDDPAPAPDAPYPGATSWPAFEQPAARSSYPASYEVRSGWAVADDSDPLTGPSPASGTPTVPGRAVSNNAASRAASGPHAASGPVSNYDLLAAPTSPQAASPFAAGAYETGDITTTPAGWPEAPSAGGGAPAGWPGQPPQPHGTGSGSHRRGPEQDYPHDYYR